VTTVKGTLDIMQEMIANGETNPASMIILWKEENTDSFCLRYMVTNESSLAETIGLLEMAKVDIINDQSE